MLLVTCNNTKECFSREPEKINVKFHKNCENTGKILKISCLCRMSFCEIWQLFSRALIRNFLWCFYRWLVTSFVLEKCKKECDIVLLILVQDFCPLKINTNQFSDRLCLIVYLEGWGQFDLPPSPNWNQDGTCNDRISIIMTLWKNRGEGGVRVCGDAVLLDFWCGFAVIFILSCGITVLQNQAVCGN